MFKNIGTDIIAGGIFERFPKLVPAIGDNYNSSNHSKMLLIGESIYFGDEWETKSVFKDVNKWYYDKNALLIPNEKLKDVDNWYANDQTFDNLYNSMRVALQKSGVNDFNNYLLNEATFYNYFLRPASVKILPNGKTNFGFKKNRKDDDCKVAYYALRGVIERIKPNIVIFVSSLAWEWFLQYFGKEIDKSFAENIIIDFVNHPSKPRTWHNKNGDGKQKFERLLYNHWLIQKPDWSGNWDKLDNLFYLLKGKNVFSLIKGEFSYDTYNSLHYDKEFDHYAFQFLIRDTNHSFCFEMNVPIEGTKFWTGFYSDNDSHNEVLEMAEDFFDINDNDEDVVRKIEEKLDFVREMLKKID